MYSVALWLVCQVVDVISDPLDLPDWTLTFIIVIGLIGFPVALILSWLFDVTREGVVTDRGSLTKAVSRRPFDQVLDCLLVVAATVICLQLATGIITNEAVAETPVERRIAVFPFVAAAGERADLYGNSLMSEIQHVLTKDPGTIVIAPREVYLDDDGLTLTGVVAIGETTMRVTANLVENETGEVTWSGVFERAMDDDLHVAAQVAKDIAAALPRHESHAVTPADSHSS